MRLFKCCHPAEQLIIEKDQTIEPYDEYLPEE